MLFFLIWILMNTTMASAGELCGVCGRPISDKGSFQDGYPSWFPSSGYDKTNLGYPSMNQFPSTHHHHEHQYPSSGGYSSGGYSSGGGYPSAMGYQPPVDGNLFIADKGYQAYPAYNGDKNGFYDTGFKGFHNTWSEKGSGQHPGMSVGQLPGMSVDQHPVMNNGPNRGMNGYDRVDYLDGDSADTYARRGYQGYPSYSNGPYKINRVKKQSANSTVAKTR